VIFEINHLFTFIHCDKHLEGASDIFWIKSLNGAFLALQIKAFDPKISNFMQGLESAILAFFQNGLCPVSAALKNLGAD
jgi:hypothetical protein